MHGGDSGAKISRSTALVDYEEFSQKARLAKTLAACLSGGGYVFRETTIVVSPSIHISGFGHH
jgi:hypothetical protein